MKKIEELGVCPNCDCSICIYKTNNYKRFAKCEICGLSYPLPKKGTINNSALMCPNSRFPLLIIDRPNQKAYFWADRPCFSCVGFDKCEPIKELIEEFRGLEVYGY
jgi:hypothetical protein